MPPFIQRADERAHAWLTRRQSPILDKTLPRLSHLANHSRLWIAAAGVLALTGGRKGRSAAARGLIAIGVASSAVNGPLKLMSRRHRPQIVTVPLPRRLRRMPWTSSFPSGHATSAAAFATAASLELPAAAVPLGILGGGVALSRVYSGVHYPSDVVVGAAIGVGAAVATHRVAEARRRSVPPATSLAQLGSLDLHDGTNLVVAVNPEAGSAKTDLVETIRESFPAAAIVMAEEDFVDELRARCTPETEAIAVAGGDGTVNAVTTLAMERGLPLGVIPAGTLNHFARDLGLEDAEAGIEALRNGALAQVDVGMIAERPFLNTASFGAYSMFVDRRESLEERLGKWPAAMVALVEMMRTNTPVRVEIDGQQMSIWAIFIGNGPYAPQGFIPLRRTALADGLLDVRVLRADRSRPEIMVAQGLSRMQRSSAFEAWSCEAIDVRSLDGPLRLAHDGETFDGPASFRVEKSPKQLSVFVPQQKG